MLKWLKNRRGPTNSLRPGELEATRPSTAPLRQSYISPDTCLPLLDTTLGDLMRKIASEVPDRIALVEGVADPSKRRRWTYRQLVDQSEKAARGLLNHFKPGDRVAFLAPDTPEWVILQHAVSFAGLILVPINPAYTARELEFVLKSSEASGLVFAETSRGKDLRALVEEVRPRLPHLIKVISMADFDSLLASADPARELPRVTPDQTIQIQYTSGTTGFPKARVCTTGASSTRRAISRCAQIFRMAASGSMRCRCSISLATSYQKLAPLRGAVPSY